ncbi:hypothetical protein NQ038_01790 [Brevibacterium sp. 50QC2O2]|uniref:hypothetical protein n=1 Tax=Brevibacterium sp. 50QC2O2 TaxID=2968459 RepID=UPI00211CB6C7|nr:hypothetical protein [Brevibacterium sp. 50QC2O2]MCQ9387381.1 hypothetical protein [Brevibacterium sp. 50QC2O2]
MTGAQDSNTASLDPALERRLAKQAAIAALVTVRRTVALRQAPEPAATPRVFAAPARGIHAPGRPARGGWARRY